MKITDAAIQLASSHTAVDYSERRESLTVWQQGRPSDQTGSANATDAQLRVKAQALAEQAAKISLSAEARQKAAQPAPAQPDVGAIAEAAEDDQILSDLNLRILKTLFERLTGRTIKVLDPGDFEQPASNAPPAAASNTPEQAAQVNQGWGVRYERHDLHHEEETTQFQAQGLVSTADGRQIAIEVALNMSRSFTRTEDELFLAGDALKDPLVINFAGTAAQLTHDTFSFDIDADGENDQISFLEAGSGFLALDANGDGGVNDGRELFGALSGDGFADLAAHDDDGNGWIDEGDAVFNQLRIWTKTADGQDQLLTLTETGVGALYLKKVATPFALKNDANELQGQVRASSIFLREQGGAGVVQQLDLVA